MDIDKNNLQDRDKTKMKARLKEGDSRRLRKSLLEINGKRATGKGITYINLKKGEKFILLA